MVTYGRLQDNIANCNLQNSTILIMFKTLGIRNLSQKYMGDKNLSSNQSLANCILLCRFNISVYQQFSDKNNLLILKKLNILFSIADFSAGLFFTFLIK